MIATLISLLPMAICAGWVLTFLLHYGQLDRAKRWLTCFLLVCTVLYSCHAVYYNFYLPADLPASLESVWALCSLSVFPLYYIYICQLTWKPQSRRSMACLLLPGIVVATAILLWPSPFTDNVRKAVFSIQVLLCIWFGQRRLKRFDQELCDVYADTEGRDTRPVRHLLTAFLLTSVLSAVVNMLGKQYVASNEWLVVLLFGPFAVLLFALAYIGYTRRFSVEQLAEDMKEDAHPAPSLADGGDGAASAPDNGQLGQKIEQLMNEERFYLTKNLKITDLSNSVGVCRTYVSNYINQTEGCSFSDYINRRRIAYAQQLLLANTTPKMSSVADMAGFSNEQSFYRNFRKFTGMNPKEYASQAATGENSA